MMINDPNWCVSDPERRMAKASCSEAAQNRVGEDEEVL